LIHDSVMKSRRRTGHSSAHQREGDIMSVSGISSGNNLYPAALQSANSQRRTDFQALGSALQSSDLAGAQAAFAALQRDLQGVGQTQAQSGVQSDYQNLATALQSGDLPSAQKAFAALRQDLQTVLHRHSHHHHHHHGDAVAPASATSEASSTSAASASSTDSQSAGGSIDLRG
jgi:hypothetical protein